MNNEDMSDVFEKMNNISPDMVNNFLNMINNSNQSGSKDNKSTSTSDSPNFQESSNNSGIDFETILKMKNIIDRMNTKNDPRSNLLQSLKPYLNDSRKLKVDQYINLMNMSKVLDVFPFLGGEQKNDK